MNKGTLHEGVAFLEESFLRNIFALSHNSTGCLLFIGNYVVANIKYSPTRDRSYFLFDSHCRNSREITDSPFGFSVLLQFADLIQIERYNTEAYNVANLAYPTYFQIQFISVNVDDSDISAIQACQVNLGQTRREKSKERMRITRLKNISSFQGSDETSRKSDRVSVFKKFIKLGPCFICIARNRCLYRKSVVVLSKNKHKELVNNMFHFIPSHDNSFYICKTCVQKLN